jgi:hypothetical protein
MFLRISLAVALALLAQNPAPQGVRVSGRVVGLPPGTPSGMMRANMARSGLEVLESLIDADGRFEFANVPPGQYTLHIIGPNQPSMRVTVAAGADITNLSVTLPPLILGHATVEGGGSLPRQASGGTVPPATLQLEARRVGGGAGVDNVTPRGDGPFLLPIASLRLGQLWLPMQGEYWLRPRALPIGYELKSMTFGNVDLMKQPLAVALPMSGQTIEIVLAKTQASGVHVSGRVKDIPAPTGNLTPVRRASLATIRTATNPQMGKLVDTQYSAEVLLNADGFFDLQGITPGRYILQAPGVFGMPLEVGTSDINQLEFSAASTPEPGTNLLFKLQTAFPITPPVVPNKAATIVVSERRDPKIIDVEGSWGYLRVTASDALIDEKRLVERASTSIRLASGSYELIFFTRPCNGNCGNLSAPLVECRLSVTLAAGETLTLNSVHAGATCTLKITSRR